MKKICMLWMILTLIFSLTACGQKDAVQESTSETMPTSESGEEELADDGAKQTPITLTIGDTVLEAYLNDSVPAQSLISQLPLTVTLNDSDNDFCGDSLDIEYSDSDVTSGYENGDLVFWTPASNFVIFVSGEENSGNTGNLVKLGRVTSPQDMLDTLEGQIDVTIALAENTVAGTEGSSTTAEETIESKKAEETRIKITVDDTELYANLEDNVTTRAWLEQMPMTLSMQDLYGREMCYRYGADAMPAEELRSDEYEVGDIAYWPPRGSLVILYEQNGEQFERQHLGHIDSGVEVFQNTGDVDVKFEVMEEPE